MEDVLDFYERSPQPGVIRLCFDEKPCQLLGEIVAPLPMKSEQIKKQDYEYERNGHCVILLAYDLDQGKRFLQVRKHRKKQDYAEFMQWLVERHYPQAEAIEIVQDNLNTHSYGAFYENLPCQQAHELKNKINFHFTPKHASWLNMAEIEFSALSKQCLDRRIATMEALEQETLAWMQQRNDKFIKIDWKFNKLHARDKLQRLYKNVNSNN
jgi:hypothetical protein